VRHESRCAATRTSVEAAKNKSKQAGDFFNNDPTYSKKKKQEAMDQANVNLTASVNNMVSVV
jgi:hypothetical protein